MAAHGPIGLVVAWIHGVAFDAHNLVAQTIATRASRFRYVAVLGSASDDPSASVSPTVGPGSTSGLELIEVVLGFVIEQGSSRWLTDPEIAQGVLAAARGTASRVVVGTTRPWSARP